MEPEAAMLHIQICHAEPNRQTICNLTVAEGTSLEQAIRQSDAFGASADGLLASHKVGIYGKLKPLDTVLREHDRIEIYRPLIADPKDARRRRAKKTDR